MSTSSFFMPSVNLIGSGCLSDAAAHIARLGLKRALIVTDPPLVKLGIVAKVSAVLAEQHIGAAVFDGVQPNPTTKNVTDGLAILKAEQADFVISLGGGSPHDCAKGIALLASNGGDIRDYEGLDKSKHPQLPLVAINTTAGTASEMTRFAIITDETRHVKMAIVDQNTTPILSVNDPDLMLLMPVALTAATGMDALTHAVEAYVSSAATPITDACAIKAIELIAVWLPKVVADGRDVAAREQMAYAQFLAGMAFNNASLGYVHAMAHQLGGFYDLPHGVCNAILLPHVEAYNVAVAAKRLGDVARALGADTTGLGDVHAAEAAIDAIRRLSAAIGIPKGVRELGAKESDIPTLATNALKDVCGLTNPRQATFEEICAIYKAAL